MVFELLIALFFEYFSVVMLVASVVLAVLFAPRGLPLAYMTAWALWTALLRPLAGESAFESLERAGNYGVPLALLLMTAFPRSLPALVTRLDGPGAKPERPAGPERSTWRIRAGRQRAAVLHRCAGESRRADA